MKILMLLSNELKQLYVLRELSKYYNIIGIVIEDKYPPSNRIKTVLKEMEYNIFKIIQVIYYKLKFRKYEIRNKKIIDLFFLENRKSIEIENRIPMLKVEYINSAQAISFIKEKSPDLIVVFGTSLIKREIMSIPKIGIINAHTGLSPYYRGGQCTFWCLYNDEPEYIGVTIHWLSKGIDSGDIILQGRPQIVENDTLCSIECKLAVLATDLLKKVIEKIENGTTSGVKQETEGKLYLSRQFTLVKRLELERRIKQGLIKRYLERKDQIYNKVKIFND